MADKATQLKMVKQAIVGWINKQMEGLLGDGFAAKLIRPFVEEVVSKYSESKAIDAVLGMFVDESGHLDLDNLMDKYIDILMEDGDIRFRWGDILPAGAMLDKINGDRINVITAEDLKELKQMVAMAITKAIG